MYYELLIRKKDSEEWLRYWIHEEKMAVLNMYKTMQEYSVTALKVQAVSPPPEYAPIADVAYWEKE